MLPGAALHAGIYLQAKTPGRRGSVRHGATTKNFFANH